MNNYAQARIFDSIVDETENNTIAITRFACLLEMKPVTKSSQNTISKTIKKY